MFTDVTADYKEQVLTVCVCVCVCVCNNHPEEQVEKEEHVLHAADAATSHG